MDKQFKDIIIEAIEQNGTNLGKLAESSRIPQRYLELIIRGENSYLPAAPYIHGYIIRLAHNLELDGELLWELYKKENSIKISGGHDKLPSNRFSIQNNSNTKMFVIGGIALLALIYIVFKFNDLFSSPSLTILDPNQESVTTSSKIYTIIGSTKNEIKITINEELIDLDENNGFQKEVLLEPGLNTFKIKASKFLGGTSEIIRQIIFEEASKIIKTPDPTE
ncbi:MAG: hypothetical protein COV57_00245 [Candidatus Liptonbacteria bacterium CG11_big_fil_rev_8_21_14_0_20_35_14]|uniref:HTH cro/C1-type domain-containing protein n=1 Tax=Candidatus Liptonbacteria bacterium CG11_big_fil_rev_8_21_14_0_20_35_14 TaxID=1974634 RepID=A0A2H0N8J7_9BACT|nr:MAG: hypothetical protein COV57_00245 [Candidatus Liptonbacteria bacterium CG11_big_fil_rev_8_21_14_0_20_35_14]